MRRLSRLIVIIVVIVAGLGFVAHARDVNPGKTKLTAQEAAQFLKAFESALKGAELIAEGSARSNWYAGGGIQVGENLDCPSGRRDFRLADVRGASGDQNRWWAVEIAGKTGTIYGQTGDGRKLRLGRKEVAEVLKMVRNARSLQPRPRTQGTPWVNPSSSPSPR